MRLKSNAPLRYASADRRGFMRSGHRRSNVSSTCLMRRSYKWRGEFGLKLESPAMRWGLIVWIYLYTIRDRCRPDGTSWCVSPAYLINFFIRAEHSLSRICRRGCRPLYLRCSYNFFTVRSSSVLARDVSGSARMASLSYSNTAMMYFPPLLDVTGNCPI